MLLAFYPAVSPAALAQAWRERPAYFAGGVLFGTKGDKLRLPDGREWDCIVAAGGPSSGQRWQAVLIDPTAGGDGDPFALEEGPLAPLDDAPIFAPRAGSTYTDLVNQELAPLGGGDDRLQGAANAVASFDGSAALDDAFAHTIAPAEAHHAATIAALDGDAIPEVLEATSGAHRVIDGTAGEYDEDPPPDVAEPDPGGPPPGSEPDPGDEPRPPAA